MSGQCIQKKCQDSVYKLKVRTVYTNEMSGQCIQMKCKDKVQMTTTWQ